MICDSIYRDETTKKLILVGVFNTIQVVKFPFVHPRMSVLFTLSEGQGTHELELAVQHAGSGEDLARISGKQTFESPLQIIDFNLELGPLHFPEPGKYCLCLSVDGELIRQRPFVVASMEGGYGAESHQ